MDFYGVMASYYDELFFGDDYYKVWSNTVVSAVKRYAKGVNGLDAGTGTGLIADKLIKEGFSVTGVDISKDMLNIAMQKGIPCVLQDIKKLNGFNCLDFITSVNDTINYVQPKDLKKVFSNYNTALKKGGFLTFDISTVKRLTGTLSNNVFSEDYDDLTYVWFNTQKKAGVQIDLTFFIPNGDIYNRFDESHFLYKHNVKGLLLILKECGFTLIKLTDTSGKKITVDKAEDIDRVLFYLKKD